MTTTDIHIHDARTPEERDRPFLPGMGKSWLMPLYDLVARAAGVRSLQEKAVAQAGIRDGESVLDVGCGTGNLALAVLRAVPGSRVTGLDPDAAALRRAARKAVRRGVRLSLVQGYADRLPAEDGSLDHIVSSLALHHVDDEGRRGFAAEVLRALRPGGRVTIVDFGGPGADGEAAEDGPEHGHGRSHRHGRGHGLMGHLRRRAMHNPHVAPNLDNGLVALLADAGLADAHEAAHVEHRMGEVTIVTATRP